MPRPKGSKNKTDSEVLNELNEETVVLQETPEEVEEPVSVPYENQELKELREIHSLMTARGIKDIGQLEVLISKLQ